jgi:hypothetical protein
MCDFCKDKFLSIREHLFVNCPIRKGTYCCLCACYGHLPRNCAKDKLTLEPEFLEQLIPPSLLEENGVNTCTNLITNKIKTKFPPTQAKIHLDYIDEPRKIHDLLKTFNDMPRKEKRGKDKYKEHLIQYAKRHNLLLVAHTLEKSDTIEDGEEDSIK